MRAAAAGPALALAGCALFSPGQIAVREVASSVYCNTPGREARVELLADAAAVTAWQEGRGIELADPESLGEGPYALVEMGLRSTGGYSLTVSEDAALRDDRVVLEAEFLVPNPGSLRTQALSSPCVLVRLPPGRYADVAVRDSSGAVRAQASQPPPPDPGPLR